MASPSSKKRMRRATIALVSACALSWLLATSAVAAPTPPVLSGTNPASPANASSLFVFGSAEAGSTVSVFPDANCSGPPYPPGSAASFASPGLQVHVPDDSTTTLSATATDASSNTSACSAPISYVEDSRPPHTLIRRLHFNRAKGTVTPVFSSDEPYTTFECSWTRWHRCIPGQRSWHIRPGRRIFRVRARDAAGNVDPSPAIKTVTYNPVV
jgi:large repetitive protein